MPVTPELKTGQEGKGKRGSEARSNGLKLREAWADPKSETGRKRIAPTPVSYTHLTLPTKVNV